MRKIQEHEDLILTSGFKNYLYNEQKASRHLNVANVSISCDRNPSVNRAAIVNSVNTVIEEHPETELVVFGEMILGWYNPGEMPEYHNSISESITRESLKEFISLAIRHGIYLCFGISELKDGNMHNAQVLLNPQGEIQAVHRKSNLKSHEKQAGYKPGPEPVTITEIKGVRTGIVICSDVADPANIWHLIRSHLDLIILSLADDLDDKQFIARCNSRMYDAWIVTANRYGYENDRFWNGHMVISNPLGELRVFGQGKAQYLTYDLKFADKHSRFKNSIRKVLVRLRLTGHILLNLKRAGSYF